MARQARSARGTNVDFDILAIKQALASAPLSVGTEERRQFIDKKNGIKPKKKTQNGIKVLAEQEKNIPEALRMSLAAADESAKEEDFERDEAEFDL